MSCLTLCGPINGAAKDGSETGAANNTPTNRAPDTVIMNRSDMFLSLSLSLSLSFFLDAAR